MASLDEQLRQIVAQKKASLEKVVRRTVFDMTMGDQDSLKKLSPVDTGRFKNNWQLGLNSINYDTSRKADPSGSDAMGAISAGIASWKLGQTMYITNALPYAYRLEHGWSQQAPAGMVQVTLANFNVSFAKAISEADL